ncbi:hypothetical protein [Human adenovirus 55]|uniref:Uncharacterized protein n=1 Tax=Human adenovirus 55 TaxID=714978 RepID=A0A075FDI0_9ADEN|nr:hypothetical protein [Human adenovirus 55]
MVKTRIDIPIVTTAMMLIVEVEIVVELFTVRFKSAVKVGLEIVLLAALLLEKVVLRGAAVVDGSTIML